MIALVYIGGLILLAAIAYVRKLDERTERERDGASFPSARTRRRS